MDPGALAGQCEFSQNNKLQAGESPCLKIKGENWAGKLTQWVKALATQDWGSKCDPGKPRKKLTQWYAYVSLHSYIKVGNGYMRTAGSLRAS